jgi:hypothetical protein
LRAAGTSEHYRGLYQTALTARRLDQQLLDRTPAEFPATAAIPPLAEAMVALEHPHDHLKSIASAGWRPLANHPDVEPAHEALLLREHFTEILRLEIVAKEPQEYRQLLRDGQESARQLEDGLRSGLPAETLSKILAGLNDGCTACHQKYRDVPLAEKNR